MNFKSQILSLAALSLVMSACTGGEEKKDAAVAEVEVLPTVKI